MSRRHTERKAPMLYEQTVPIVLGVIVVLVLGLVIITLAVLLGFWPQ